MELNEIADKHPSMKKRINSMGKSEKKAKMILKLADQPGTKLIIEHLEAMIANVEEQLLYQDNINREVLMRERDCWEWLLTQFDAQNQVLKRIEEFKKKYE